MDEQEKLADAITRKYAKNESFCEIQISQLPESIHGCNSTSVGNLAYMAIHCHPIYQQEFQTAYNTLMYKLKIHHNIETNSMATIDASQKIPLTHKIVSSIDVMLKKAFYKMVGFILNENIEFDRYSDEAVAERRVKRWAFKARKAKMQDLLTAEKQHDLEELLLYFESGYKTDPFYEEKRTSKLRYLTSLQAEINLKKG